MITIPNPTQIAGTWIRSRLAADAALAALVGDRIRPEDMHEGDAYPAVLYQWQAGMDEGCIGSPDNLVDVRCRYLVKVITKGESFGQAEEVFALVDADLNNESGTVAAGTVLYCRRDQPHVRSEVLNGDKYRHLGYFYELKVQ